MNAKRYCHVLVKQESRDRKWVERSIGAQFTAVVSFAHGKIEDSEIKRRDRSA